MKGSKTEDKVFTWPLTFSRVPFAPDESARSLPARSTRLILLTCRDNHSQNGRKRPARPGQSGGRTFSVSRLVIWSRRFWVKTMVKTAWDRDDVSFMFVAATVLQSS